MAPKKKSTEFKCKSFIQSFNYAVAGILSAFRHEFNFRFHIASALVALVLSLFFDFTRLEFLALSFTISLVFIAEMINTAIEKTVDLLSPEYAEAAGVAKDVAAGAVLISAVNAIIVFVLLYVIRFDSFRISLLAKVRANPLYIAFIIVMIIILLTIIVKSKFSKGHGTYFQGGTVSGHAMLSFSMATIIAAFSNQIVVILLAYFLAFLVAESRVEGGIHKTTEVLSGGMLGLLVTMLLLNLIR